MAELTKYETYKPSGINWIEEVPEHWEVKRLKNTCSLIYGESLAEEIRQDGVIEVFGSNGKVGEHNISNTSAPCIIVGRKGSFGKVNYSYKKVFAIDTTYFIDDRFTKNQLRWLYYTLDIIGLDKLSKDTGVPGLNREDAYNEKLPLPPKPEQLAIANYLDDQTQKIDQLIANKKAQVEKLKELRQIEINNAVTKGLNPNTEMKDSGIEWLGKIPKHWEVKRLKNILLNINSGDGISNDELVEDGEIEVYGGNGVMGYTDKFNSDGKVIIIGRVGAKCGVTYLVDKKIWISDNALQSRTYQNYEFVYYLIDAMNLNNYANQNAQPLITGGILKGLYAALPPKNEQVEIADFLQQRTTAIDQLIKNIEAQIEKLQELRKIRIYEAVTGKIKVNAYAEKTA